MIKDQSVALRDANKHRGSTIKIRFENVRGPDGKIVVNVEQPVPLLMALVPPTGMTTGVYVPGRVPGNPHDHREMKKDWFVIRSHAKADEVVRDPWPPEGVPILILVEGVSVPKMGVLVQHIRTLHGGRQTTDAIFLEYPAYPDQVSVAVSIQVQEPLTGSLMEHVFQPHDMNSVIGWTYLSSDNQMIPPKRDAMLELFVACEFEDSTKTLLSMALITRNGNLYYAFDSEAADTVQEEWVKDNVLPVLLDVPHGAHVIDLMRKYKDPDYPIKTFSDFVQWVIKLETNGSWLDPEVTIHADFPTDIGYIAPLFHLGNGERIRPMTRLNFVVDYVDSYPTGLKAAVQHNAAWDAMAMWLHMGYTAYIDPRRLANSSTRDPDLELNAPEKGDYINTWTSGTKGILEKGPSGTLPLDENRAAQTLAKVEENFKVTESFFKSDEWKNRHNQVTNVDRDPELPNLANYSEALIGKKPSN